MSYCVNIYTVNKFEPETLFDFLKRQGISLQVVLGTFPILRIGTYKKALRGIEVSLEEYGYQVKSFMFSFMSDYQLFPIVVDAVQKITNGTVYSEEDAEKPIAEPKKRFGLKWRREQERLSWEMVTNVIRSSIDPMFLNGLIRPFQLSQEIYEEYKIDIDNPMGGEQYKFLMYDLMSLQWDILHGQKKAKISYLSDPSTETGFIEVSKIILKDHVVEYFDYIDKTPLITFSNYDTQDWTTIAYEDLKYVLPFTHFILNEDGQCLRMKEITEEDFMMMFEAAKQHDYFDAAFKEIYNPNKLQQMRDRIKWYLRRKKKSISNWMHEQLEQIRKHTQRIHLTRKWRLPWKRRNEVLVMYGPPPFFEE